MLHSKWQHLLVTNSTGITVNDPFATKLGFMAYYHKLDSLVKRLDCSVVVKVKVTGKNHPVNVHLNDISSTAGPFVTKLGMVMHHHEPGCRAKKKKGKKIALLSSRLRSL